MKFQDILDKINEYLTKKPEKDKEVAKDQACPRAGKNVKKEKGETKQFLEAKKYHGLHEVRDNSKLRELLGFNPAKIPWCAGFVNAIEKKCGRLGTGKLTARSFLTYGRSVKRPKKGDIVVFRRGMSAWQGHVGYFIMKNSEGILVLGGNQNNKVCYKYYPESKLLGYRRV